VSPNEPATEPRPGPATGSATEPRPRGHPRSAGTPPPERPPSFAGWIGVGRADITPPVGIYARNWGAALTDVAEGIHRPLRATALAFSESDGGSPLVLLALDLGWWTSVADEWHVRGALLETLGLDPSRVLINLSHTHAGPSIASDDRDLPGGDLIAGCLDTIRDRVIVAAREAVDNRREAVLTWATGRCDLARNRDLPDPLRSRIVVGYNAAAPADDTLLVGRVTAADGSLIATITNYACHPTTLAWENPLISPDFVGAFGELMEAQTGAPAMFLQGASGELQPAEAYSGDAALADAHGRRLGHASLAVLAGMLPAATELAYTGVVESGAPLGVWRRAATTPGSGTGALQLDVALPLKDLPSTAAIRAELAASTDRTMQERARRKLRVREMVGDDPMALMPAWAWRLGDTVMVATVQEAYSGLQTELRRRFPDHAVVVMNLTNGSCAYLAPADLYDEDLYQVWQSPFERGCLEGTIDATAAAVERLLAEA
jgi:hypothetical protein